MPEVVACGLPPLAAVQRAASNRTSNRLRRWPRQGVRPHGTDDGFPSGEGAFGICGFWAVECLARSGDVEKAIRAFETLLERANDLGLLAEEIDPDSGAALGNFPQAFTHIGLINAALTLAEVDGQHGRVSPEQRLGTRVAFGGRA